MKSKLFVICLAVLMFPGIALAEEIKITVSGMVCTFCAQGIRKTFGKNENIQKIDVDLEDKIVKLSIKEGATLSDVDIEKTINDSGYEVIKIERGTGA